MSFNEFDTDINKPHSPYIAPKMATDILDPNNIFSQRVFHISINQTVSTVIIEVLTAYLNKTTDCNMLYKEMQKSVLYGE